MAYKKLDIKEAAEIKEKILVKGTLAEAAKKTGINKTTLSRILSRERSLNPQRATQIYTYLGCPTELKYLQNYPRSQQHSLHFSDKISEQWTNLYFTYLDQLRKLGDQFLHLPLDEKAR